MDKKIFFNNSQRTFKLFRVWSYQEGANKSQYGWLLKWMTMICTAFGLLIISLSDTIDQLRHGQIVIAVIKALYFMALGGCAYKLGTAALADDEIYACIKRMENLSARFQKTLEIDEGLRLYNKLFILGMCCIDLASILFMIVPFTTDEPRPLPFTPHLPYLNVVITPNWQLFYIYEILAVFVLTTTTIAYDTLFCGMMCLCSATISSICRELRELDDYIDDHQISDAIMKETVYKINEITQLTGEMSDVFSASAMIHMIYNCSSLVLALFMVLLLPFTDLACITMITVIILQTFQLWIYCYFGQDVVNQREVLQRELYFVRWYDASENFKGMLMLTLLETQIDRYIYAGKIIPLSLETLATVVKKAYVIVTFLNESI